MDEIEIVNNRYCAIMKRDVNYCNGKHYYVSTTCILQQTSDM